MSTTEGMITEIERFALNDGPGIRTTVFFKGCNMNCAWCHNPETISMKRDLHYYASKCISCYKCVYACPCKAQKRINNIHMYYPNLCVKCGKCAEICYAGAMAISGKKMTVAEVMHEVLQDKPYYLTSGGGVTLSGGEVLCQREFAEGIVDACHENGIKVAIRECFFALIFPILLIVLIRFGICTSTEAGAFAVAYALLCGTLVYHELSWSGFFQALKDSVIDTGGIILIISLSGIFSYAITVEQVPSVLGRMLLGITNNPQMMM